MAATPPIQIGELLDVPTPGAAIQSAWSQEVTRRSLHRFATTTERDSKYPAAGAGVGAICMVVDSLFMSNGSVWVTIAEPPKSYVPTLGGTGWAFGTGTRPAWYQRVNGSLRLWGTITFGAGMVAGSGGFTIGAPPGINLATDSTDVGSVRTTKVSVNNYGGIISTQTAATLIPQSPNAAAGNSLSAYVAGFPFAWAAGDSINFTITARMASPLS